MENVKTLWELLQMVVENDDDNWYSLHEFLLYSTEEDRKRIESKLVDADMKQYYEYMDWIHFVNEHEIYMAVCEYYEKTMNRWISMWEMWDMSEIAEDYIRDRKLKLDDDWNIIQ